MTTIYATQKVLATKTVIESCVCDWCGKQVPKQSPEGSQHREFVFTSGFGYSSEDFGGSGWCIEDLCDKCVEKLRAELEKLGIKIREIDY